MTDKNNHQDHKILMTQEGFNELEKELKVLVEKKRPKAVDRLETAREMGDLAENSEYASAVEDLTFIDGKISEIEEIIRHAEIVAKSHAQKTVRIGSQVHLTANGKEVHYTVVGEWEADPKERKISHNSPLGKAIMGKKIGDVIEVEAPVGKIKYEIKKLQ